MKCAYLMAKYPDWESLPARGAWIEIPASRIRLCIAVSRSPHGERGLKYCRRSLPWSTWESLPARGAWIEIREYRACEALVHSRSPHGERGLKSVMGARNKMRVRGRSPHGERGLKCFCTSTRILRSRRSPHGERGLKFPPKSGRRASCRSLPARGAWIEIT